MKSNNKKKKSQINKMSLDIPEAQQVVHTTAGLTQQTKNKYIKKKKTSVHKHVKREQQLYLIH